MRSSEPQTDPSTRRRPHVVKKRLPSLARRSSVPSYLLGDRRLSDLDAKLGEFAVDPWSAHTSEICAVPTDNGFAKALSTSGLKQYSPTNTKRSILPRIGHFGELRRRIELVANHCLTVHALNSINERRICHHAFWAEVPRIVAFGGSAQIVGEHDNFHCA
jgi:hypothetical protein